MFFSPGKWTPISAVSSRWLDDPHDLHRTPNLPDEGPVLASRGTLSRTTAKKEGARSGLGIKCMLKTLCVQGHIEKLLAKHPDFTH
jgi:hypothetical protein